MCGCCRLCKREKTIAKFEHDPFEGTTGWHTQIVRLNSVTLPINHRESPLDRLVLRWVIVHPLDQAAGRLIQRNETLSIGL